MASYYKIGSKWGNDGGNYYEVMKKNKVVIYKNDTNLNINDSVAIAKTGGHEISDIGIIKSMGQKLSANHILNDEFGKADNGISKYNPYYYNIEWINIENNPITYQLQQGWCEIQNNDVKNQIKSRIQKYNQNKMENKIKDLLLANKNLILTGAPGTGKTYLAKEMARKLLFGKKEENLLSETEKEEFNKRCKFVQFHPSYDYTDFVEGLRPTPPDENGNIGFERKDGVFKEFCKSALNIQPVVGNFDSVYEEFIEDIIQNPQNFSTPVQKKTFSIEINSRKTCVAIPDTEKATRMPITKEMIRDYVETGNIRDWKPYTTAIGDFIKSKYKIENKSVLSVDNKPFIFIIDEINRGEISKIFGELFFSIDPGYRGEKGEVQTQYANLIEDSDIFKDGFYVPENVYIIGTMNDIDRSVESFDFAMRRRFTWVEITAEESARNMPLSDDCKQKMGALNDAISKIDGLNSSYHVGGAYFLKKDGTPETDFDNLWRLRLKPLLFEYLRGMPDAETKLDDLKKTYES